MLVQFSLENYMSYKEEKVFSMQTAPYLKKLKGNIINLKDLNILKSAVIFGPNGSGKSNIFYALGMLRNVILNNHLKNKNNKMIYRPFGMGEGNEQLDTTFNIVLSLQDILYEYRLSYNRNGITVESLKILGSKDDLMLFERTYDEDKDNYDIYLDETVDNYLDKTRKNATYLSVLWNFNNKHANLIVDWFKNDLLFLSKDLDADTYGSDLFKLEENKVLKKNFLQFLKIADYNIIDIEVKKSKEKMPEEARMFFESLTNDQIEEEYDSYDVYCIYNKYDSSGEVIGKTSIDTGLESSGTNKMIVIALVLLDALSKGQTVLIDEFDSSFHEAISIFLLKIFNSEVYNKKAQFILNSHDVSLLRNDILRVDQIWFVDKNKDNTSDLYSLYDFNDTNNKSRSDVSFASDYIKGKFGALPVINEFILNNNIFTNMDQGE